MLILGVNMIFDETVLVLGVDPDGTATITPDTKKPYYLYVDFTFDTVVLTYTIIDPDYAFDYWTIDSGEPITEASISVDMGKDHSVTLHMKFVERISIT